MKNVKRKPKDSPAFKASGLKSIKEFENKYHQISVNGANESNIIMMFEADMKYENNINITSSISAYAQND